MHGCIFCEIAAGMIPVHKVYDDDDVIVFLDHEPIRTGHMLILTRAHYPYFDDVPPELFSYVCMLGQKLAKIQRELLQVSRAGMMFSGNDIAHCHAHIVPLRRNTDLTSGRYFPSADLDFVRRPRARNTDLEYLSDKIGTRFRLGNVV